MLLVTTCKLLPYMQDQNLRVFNLSSLKEGYEKLHILPLNNIQTYDEAEFDILYANMILSNDHMFMEFFKIIESLYIGQNVCILVGENHTFEYITESLMKLIQQRYGYICNYIYDINDIDDIEKQERSDFSLMGLYNLDIDKERILQLNIEANKYE